MTAAVELKVKDGKISEFAIDPKACALGQAAASVLAQNIIGATPEENWQASPVAERG